MVGAIKTPDEVTILSRAIRPDTGDWPVEIANGIMSILLAEDEPARKNEQAGPAAAGALTQDEELEIETPPRAPRVIELLKRESEGLTCPIRSTGFDETWTARSEQLVWSRAKFCCEYCRFPFEYADAPFQIDHIIALKHEGLTNAENSGAFVLLLQQL